MRQDLQRVVYQSQLGFTDESRVTVPHQMELAWRSHHYAKENAIDRLVNVFEKTVQWANQQVFEPNENEEPIAFAVFRKHELRRCADGLLGIWRQCQNEACQVLQPSFADHIRTHELDGAGRNDWGWTLCERSLASMGIVQMPMNDAMCHPSRTGSSSGECRPPPMAPDGAHSCAIEPGDWRWTDA